MRINEGLFLFEGEELIMFELLVFGRRAARYESGVCLRAPLRKNYVYAKFSVVDWDL